jgi:uncharacterized protein (DUF2235 family)
MTSISRFVTPSPKKLIICCDGTWQSSTSLDPAHGTPSNVSRLCRILANAGTGVDPSTKSDIQWQQIVYYDAGVGTGDISDFDKALQGRSSFDVKVLFGNID